MMAAGADMRLAGKAAVIHFARMFDADDLQARPCGARQAGADGAHGHALRGRQRGGFLASDEAPYITGTELVVDGGLTGKYA